jgi:hypothetical protein
VLLADGFVWVLAGLFVFGVVGLMVTAVALAVRLLRFVFRAIAGTDSGGRQLGGARRGRLVCPEPRCGQVNPADARYCARCGRPFQHDHDLDAYG